MYPFVLGLHNILRWIILLLAVVAVTRATLGWLGKRAWTPMDRVLGISFSSAMDVQLLLGLLLYFVFSPLTRAFFQNFSGAMGNRELRYYGLEHLVFMLVAVVLVHIGNSRAKKAEKQVDRHRQSAIWYAIAVIIILIGIPWNRPLLPGIA